MRLYHGSSVMIEKPDVSRNTGFSDLGRGFYLTDDLAIARKRAVSRARIDGTESGVVSVYEFDQDAIEWMTWDVEQTMPESSRWGLSFVADAAGIAAWARYIKSCRAGRTEIEGAGEPEVVQAWIATEEIEMVCSGLLTADELATYIDPRELVVQYCIREQRLVDEHLGFVETITLHGGTA